MKEWESSFLEAAVPIFGVRSRVHACLLHGINFMVRPYTRVGVIVCMTESKREIT